MLFGVDIQVRSMSTLLLVRCCHHHINACVAQSRSDQLSNDKSVDLNERATLHGKTVANMIPK